MKKPAPVESASALIDEKIKELGDWRGKTLAKVREIIHEADPEIVEEWKWMGTPVWSHGGLVCTGETYKSVVKMTFAKGAALKDPSGLFNSSLDGNVRRAIDIHEGDKVDEAALKDLIRAAVALNLEGKSKPKPRRARRKRAGSAVQRGREALQAVGSQLGIQQVRFAARDERARPRDPTPRAAPASVPAVDREPDLVRSGEPIDRSCPRRTRADAAGGSRRSAAATCAPAGTPADR